VFALGDKRIYIARDTEKTSDAKAWKNIDIAILPMNPSCTMTPEPVADAAEELRPSVLYLYHYVESDPSRRVAPLKCCKDIDVRIRKMR